MKPIDANTAAVPASEREQFPIYRNSHRLPLHQLAEQLFAGPPPANQSGFCFGTHQSGKRKLNWIVARNPTLPNPNFSRTPVSLDRPPSTPVTTATKIVMSFKENFAPSTFSLSSEDWDRSESDIKPSDVNGHAISTPKNSVLFPGDGVEETLERSSGGGKEGRSLSELMRLHAEKGTDVTFNAEEASRVADVLKQWINSGTSPYEGEDDFFSCSQDDSSLGSKRFSRPPIEMNGRPRGQSEAAALWLPHLDNSIS